MEAVFLSFILMLSIFLGFELIAKGPSQLHTPLMSGSNAISGIIVIGALLQISQPGFGIITILAALATLIATINIARGFLVTQRMLRMFRK
mgnify:CR=1 FL=1